MIRETFLPRIFSENKKYLSPIIGDLGTIHSNEARLGLLNPVMPAKEKYLSSQLESADLIQVATGGGAFFKYDHLLALREEIRVR